MKRILEEIANNHGQYTCVCHFHFYDVAQHAFCQLSNALFKKRRFKIFRYFAVKIIIV